MYSTVEGLISWGEIRVVQATNGCGVRHGGAVHERPCILRDVVGGSKVTMAQTYAEKGSPTVTSEYDLHHTS